MSEIQSTVRFASVPNYPGYRVDTDGGVWTCWDCNPKGRSMTDRWRPMKPSRQRKRSNGRAYLYLNLCREGRVQTFRVHRLILESFVGPCPDGMEARHIDGDPGNNRLSNLAWGTPEANRQDNRRNGRYSETARNVRFTHDGKTMCLKEWAQHLNVPYHTLYQRIKTLGMSFEEAIARPFRGASSNGYHWTRAKRARPTA